PSSNASARPPTGPDWPSTPNSTPTTTPKASKSPTSRSTRYGSPTTSFMANGTTHFAPNIAEQPTHCKGYFVPIPNAMTAPSVTANNESISGPVSTRLDPLSNGRATFGRWTLRHRAEAHSDAMIRTMPRTNVP